MNQYEISRRRFLQLGGAGTLVSVVGPLVLQGCTPKQVQILVTWLGELPTVINDYRKQNGLSDIPLSDDLTAVALKHVMDLNAYHPENTCGAQGDPHQWTHSWSNNGNWQGTYGVGAFKGCCYPPDHSNKPCMWDKPKEIANYPSNGYEIAHWSSGAVTAQSALNDWKTSPGHNDVILNKGQWASFQWQALGAIASGNYACAWFGTVKS